MERKLVSSPFVWIPACALLALWIGYTATDVLLKITDYYDMRSRPPSSANVTAKNNETLSGFPPQSVPQTTVRTEQPSPARIDSAEAELPALVGKATAKNTIAIPDASSSEPTRSESSARDAERSCCKLQHWRARPMRMPWLRCSMRKAFLLSWRGRVLIAFIVSKSARLGTGNRRERSRERSRIKVFKDGKENNDT